MAKECGYERCLHHTHENRYGWRPLLCRLSIHRHWEDNRTGSPPPWYNNCLLCGYGWIRRLNSKPSKYAHDRWAWWWKAPWPIKRPLLWLLHHYRWPRALVEPEPVDG